MTIDAEFHTSKGDFVLDVALSISSCGVTALFGPSGSGKTTILRLMAGLEHIENGYMKVGDHVWQRDGFFVPPHRRAIGYVFQEASLFPHLNVYGNLLYAVKRVPKSEQKVSMERVVELFGIGPLLNRRTVDLSGGERQRVAIARALAASPALLFLDEPLAALDNARKLEILPCIELLRTELDIPVIYVSHSQDEVARIADSLVFLYSGRVRCSGPMSDMMTRLDLPLSHGADAESIIDATVVGHDADFHLTILDSPTGRFYVAGNNFPEGSPVRLRIYARDVSITLDFQTGTSILNIFPAVIDEIFIENGTQATVRLASGNIFILSRVTRKSVAQLDLQKGRKVFFQVKSVALLP